ncbi:sirohydrochlorin cobaltochelatase [Candidatus Acidianus copahuensis]|uniref:Sirohydrochlorin cobaltochelatase n=1 Tax=Candidatus Acidianus copahuensis TaxID=1160895 RepID=A0A031LMK1_9CREN|nr:CbiX/SirB N-terminal domain-containing protein [Candidatus Acidianus copahuensis]EZQ03110.1 sirohydrochlorin cobaltochelatase [Candidatus Acidianus copahuensis]
MIGVLLALHGSRIDEWSDIAEKYKDLLTSYFDFVEYGFLEFNKPTLREATESLASKGVDKIVVVPLLFAAGMHFYRDIPKLIGIENNKIIFSNKQIEIRITKPIGVDKRIADILRERIEETL